MGFVELAWIVGPLMYGALMGWAWFLLSLGESEFRNARILTIAAPVPLLGASVMWAVTTDSSLWIRFVVAGFIGAFSLIAVSESLRWIASREERVELPTQRTGTKRSFHPATQTEFVKSLSERLPEGGHAEISIIALQFRPFAETLDALFKAAGWHTTFNKIPISPSQAQKTHGFGISAFNKYYLDSAVEVFQHVGITDVYSELRETSVPETNAKWPMVQKKIYLTIGYVNE